MGTAPSPRTLLSGLPSIWTTRARNTCLPVTWPAPRAFRRLFGASAVSRSPAGPLKRRASFVALFFLLIEKTKFISIMFYFSLLLRRLYHSQLHAQGDIW